MEYQELINFEKKVASFYEQGKIKAPVHLRDGNEKTLINIFKNIKPDDTVFCTWASHLHALLKGIPQERVLQDILNGKSISLQYPDYNFYTSAIVGGICPISTGVAAGLSIKNSTNRVWSFIGDMGALTGIATECIRYSLNFNLPITWIIEDNKFSVETNTSETWGSETNLELQPFLDRYSVAKVLYYKYTKTYPHAGTGVFVNF
jgi:TPP-dependent pyruvate/acetoin dehydrogenase alpha subunit